jgi:hypothetical protein
MHTQQHPSGLGGTIWRWHGEYTSTNVKENTAHLSYAPSANPRSQIHTSLVAVDSLPSSELNATTVHSYYYSNTYISLMDDDGPSYVRTWALIPVTNFSNLMVDIDTPTHTHHQGIPHSTQEGPQDDKSDDPAYP